MVEALSKPQDKITEKSEITIAILKNSYHLISPFFVNNVLIMLKPLELIISYFATIEISTINLLP